MNFRTLQVRPGTTDIYTDQGDYVGTVTQHYAEELVNRFNTAEEREDELAEMGDTINSLRAEVALKDDTIMGLKEDLEAIYQGEEDVDDLDLWPEDPEGAIKMAEKILREDADL